MTTPAPWLMIKLRQCLTNISGPLQKEHAHARTHTNTHIHTDIRLIYLSTYVYGRIVDTYMFMWTHRNIGSTYDDILNSSNIYKVSDNFLIFIIYKPQVYNNDNPSKRPSYDHYLSRSFMIIIFTSHVKMCLRQFYYLSSSLSKLFVIVLGINTI